MLKGLQRMNYMQKQQLRKQKFKERQATSIFRSLVPLACLMAPEAAGEDNRLLCPVQKFIGRISQPCMLER
jgi:hypothetical protein